MLEDLLWPWKMQEAESGMGGPSRLALTSGRHSCLELRREEGSPF